MEKRYIKFNEDVEFEVEVTLRNMFGEIIELEYSLEHSTKKKAIYSYECEQYSVYAGLEVCTFDDYSYIDVDVSITSRSGYDMRYMLNGYNTFAIDFTPCFKTKQIFGSYYYEGVKCDCWARHFHANSFEQLKDRMASLVWNYNDTYYHILPLCDSHYKSELKGCNSCLTLTTAPYCGGFSNVKCKAAVVSWGKNPFETARNTVRKGFEVLNLRNAMTENTRISDVFNYLGWCSWDSMGVNVTSSGIYKKLD